VFGMITGTAVPIIKHNRHCSIEHTRGSTPNSTCPYLEQLGLGQNQELARVGFRRMHVHALMMMMMMMPFNCSYRNRNVPTAIYPLLFVLAETKNRSRAPYVSLHELEHHLDLRLDGGLEILEHSTHMFWGFWRQVLLRELAKGENVWTADYSQEKLGVWNPKLSHVGS
jgi:hypothetical protein